MKNFRMIGALCLSLCLSACSDGGEEELKPVGTTFEIAAGDLTVNLEKEAKDVLIPVNTDLQDAEWNVKSDASWCVAEKSPNGKNIRLSVTASEEPEVRQTVVRATSTLKNYEIKVSQLGYGPAILLKTNPQKIASNGGNVDVEVTTNVDYAASEPSASWITEEEDRGGRGFVTYTRHYVVEANPDYSERTAEILFSDNRSGAEKLAEPVTLVLLQEAREGNVADVVVEGDIQIKPTGGQASEAQPGYEIDKTWDGSTDPATHYHSRWNNQTEFPVTLEYFFEGNQEAMDYLVYHTRNGNGNFGEFDLYIATESEPEYVLYGSYDFKMQSTASRLDFKESIQSVTKVKFEVKTGLGDGVGNYVSCSEMQFFRKNTEKTLDAQLLTVFKDLTCTELKEGVTDEMINALPSYFGKLAVMIRNNAYTDYEKEFRIQEYKPYSNPVEWAEKLMTKKYTLLDNMTGISVKDGDEVILLVGDTYGHSISVQNVGEENAGDYMQTAASGDTYMLQPGVNKINIKKTGMLFIIYHTDLTSPNAKPIKIHIPVDCGEVAGYFDLERHKTNEKYKEIISQSSYKYFGVRGKRMIFYFHRDKMKQAVPEDILSAIGLWDDIVGWQHELMGIEDVFPTQMNNHLFAISPEGSYMWASDYRVAFVYTYLNNILLKENVMAAKDNAWGPAHEIGHIHQRAINWPSCTESSNNLFSNYILYKLGKYCSRGAVLAELATCRFVNGDAWYNMGDATHQNESTEIHMRMNWQLWNYYHRCGYMTDFWPKLFQALREDRIVESNPGAGQLHFAKMACKVANQDLTDFFEMWGFFEPVDNVTYEQYGTWNYNVTPEMIDEAKRYMSQFPKAKHAFYYLEDRKAGDEGLDVTPSDVGYYEQFKDNQKITKEITHTRSGQTVTISDGDEAVAFELYNKDGECVYFSNMFKFTVPTSIPLDEQVKVYAVQADGERVEVK